jgi:hypothetical protein
MIEQIFDSFRKAAESSLQTQQEMFKQWTQQWPSAQSHAAGTSAELTDAAQKRFASLLTGTLERDRELMDTSYRTAIELVEQTFQLTAARSPDECKQLVEKLWRKLLEVAKEQSASQLRTLKTSSDSWLEMVPKAGDASSPA